MIKYEVYTGVLEDLEPINPTKIRLTDGNEMPESIWCKRTGKHIILMNNALAFYPFPSWGLIIESTGGSIDVESIKNAEPSVLTVIPEMYQNLLDTKFILSDGTINPDKDPSEINHAPENE